VRILSLELQNIKSYRESTRIEFTPGLNAVCGMNGSGKTTVLEAIGYVLFDFLPYNQKAFVREGEKSGTIRLRFIAEDDREYEIFRKIGSGAQYYVMDLENDFKLADRGPDVLSWVQTNALGIDAHTDMEALFKNAVGVPQGLMTSDFLGAAGTRKGIFDPLLRVEEYRRAFEELRETMNYLREQSSMAEVEIARLEAETDRISEVRASADQYGAQVRTGTDRVESLSASLTDVEARCSTLDEVQRRLVELDGNHKDAVYDVSRFGDEHQRAQERLESARAAHRVVVESQAGYLLFKQADAALKELDDRRSLRDGLRASQAKVKGALDGTRRQIERLEGELKSARDAAMLAAALEEQAGRQIRLEREQHEVAAVLSGLEELDARRKRAEIEIERLARQAGERELRLGEARAAQQEAVAWPAAQERTREIWTALALLEPLSEELAQVSSDGKSLKEQAKLVAEEVRQRDELRAEFERLRPHAEQIESLRDRQQELRDERARVSAALEYQDVARQNLEQRNCPLLEMQCPVVTSNVAVLDRFSGRMRDLQDRRGEIEGLMKTLSAELAQSQAAGEQSQNLQVRMAKLESSEDRLADLRKALDECITRHKSLSSRLSHQDELRASHATAVAEEQRLQGRHELGQLVLELESALTADSTRLRDVRAESGRLDEQRSALSSLQERLRTLGTELTALGDPRASQSRYLAQAARQAEVDANLRREQKRREDDEGSYRALSEELLPFETLDEEIRERREVLDTHRPAYEAYLHNGAEAAQVNEREARVREASGKLDEARKREHAAAAERAATAERYSADEHEELRGQCREIGHQLVAEQTMLQQAQRDLHAVQDELVMLHRQQDKLMGLRAEHGELGRVTNSMSFIRDTIKSAGPAVTETLLAHISQGANDIFAEIMDDHTVELRWDRDYEVIAQRGAESRKFNQLSGGEQMSAALAVRLALLKEMSDVDFAFFDEPTQNMDGERRSNLAIQIGEIRGFDQLIVISHDDTFEHHTENVIRIAKSYEETRLETG
jgi:DNA repair protein SbcC/Rad50